ncbi:MAG: hypothetical protein EKK29_21165 [Hyphomicrobiales bacterium]|nr:MAG: hypothetical protein EKK29_21165 [Hyphomicrobiales bacterium]
MSTAFSGKVNFTRKYAVFSGDVKDGEKDISIMNALCMAVSGYRDPNSELRGVYLRPILNDSMVAEINLDNLGGLDVIIRGNSESFELDAVGDIFTFYVVLRSANEIWLASGHSGNDDIFGRDLLVDDEIVGNKRVLKTRFTLRIEGAEKEFENTYHYSESFAKYIFVSQSPENYSISNK